MPSFLNFMAEESYQMFYVYKMNIVATNKTIPEIFDIVVKKEHYCMSKQSSPIFIVCSLYKNGQDFLDMQYY